MTQKPFARHAPAYALLAALVFATAGAGVGCGAQGTSLTLDEDTPLRGLRVAVLAHPEKLDEPETDENVMFHDYVAGLNEHQRPFQHVELVQDRNSSTADLFLSLNLDINYIKQTSRAAYIPKLLTLYLYNLFGFPNSIASAHYHLSAVLYDRNNNILNAFYIHEPVTFAWKNLYWDPEPEKAENLRFVFNRLLATLDREMRHWQSGEPHLGSFQSLDGPAVHRQPDEVDE